VPTSKPRGAGQPACCSNRKPVLRSHAAQAWKDANPASAANIHIIAHSLGAQRHVCAKPSNRNHFPLSNYTCSRVCLIVTRRRPDCLRPRVARFPLPHLRRAHLRALQPVPVGLPPRPLQQASEHVCARPRRWVHPHIQHHGRVRPRVLQVSHSFSCRISQPTAPCLSCFYVVHKRCRVEDTCDTFVRSGRPLQPPCPVDPLWSLTIARDKMTEKLAVVKDVVRDVKTKLFQIFKVGVAAAHTSHLTPHTSHLTLHTSHLTPHTSHLTPHTSHLTPHTSHLTPHTSHLTPHTSPQG
jgi:hypothetical protein